MEEPASDRPHTRIFSPLPPLPSLACRHRAFARTRPLSRLFSPLPPLPPLPSLVCRHLKCVRSPPLSRLSSGEAMHPQKRAFTHLPPLNVCQAASLQSSGCDSMQYSKCVSMQYRVTRRFHSCWLSTRWAMPTSETRRCARDAAVLHCSGCLGAGSQTGLVDRVFGGTASVLRGSFLGVGRHAPQLSERAGKILVHDSEAALGPEQVIIAAAIRTLPLGFHLLPRHPRVLRPEETCQSSCGHHFIPPGI